MRATARLGALALLTAWLGNAADVGPAKGSSTVRHVRYVMGTLFEVRVRAADQAAAEAGVETALRRIREVDRLLSDYRQDSETSKLNRAARGQAVPVSREMREVLLACERIVRTSGGAFDPTVRPIVRAWSQAAELGKLPADHDRLKRMVGWSKLGFSSDHILKRGDGVELDFGAIGKGWALDVAARELRKLGLEDAYLSAGESVILALGDGSEGESGWTVWLRNPFQPEGPPIARIRLRNRALSTSAGYERDIVLHGRRYSHIIDPRSGEPVDGVAATSVIAPSAADADALSTAIYVAGPGRAKELLTPYQADALLVLADRSIVTIGTSESFELGAWRDGVR